MLQGNLYSTQIKYCCLHSRANVELSGLFVLALVGLSLCLFVD
jgi:hypothetical protein